MTVLEKLTALAEVKPNVRASFQRWARADEAYRNTIGAYRDGRARIDYCPRGTSVGRFIEVADLAQRDAAAALVALEEICEFLLREVA